MRAERESSAAEVGRERAGEAVNREHSEVLVEAGVAAVDTGFDYMAVGSGEEIVAY